MKRIFFATLMLCLFTALTFAQTTTGRLVGTVSSPDGLLPGATVVVTDNQTQREVTATTSDDGGFKFEQLSFGTYTVSVKADGFKTFIANEVKIDANRDYTLNSTLEVGGQEQIVTVQAGTDIVNATDAALSNTVSSRQVLELPLNGRNPLGLLNLQAGVNATSSSINGQRSSSQNYARDGINIQDNFIRTGGFVIDQPTVDDTGEFTVVTQNAGAELGGGGSTQVLLVTPRGGSDFHGALWEYNRNSRFSANKFGNNATGIDKPFLNRNQFGAKISGPVPLPGFGEGTPVFFKNKGFFFAQYERFDKREDISLTRGVLLGAARNGNFTYRDNAGVTRTVNVLSGTGLNLSGTANTTAFNNAGGVLAVDPTITTRFLSLTPTIGNGRVLNSGLTQEFNFNQRTVELRNGFTGRFDVDFNDQNSVYFVYKYNDIADDRTDADAGGFGQRPFVNQSGPTQLYIANYRTILGSNFVNEVRGAYAPSQPFFNQATDFPSNFVIGGIPLGLSSPEASFEDQGRNTKQYTFQDNASYTAGKHTFRFGIDFNAQRIESISAFNRAAAFNITDTLNPNTPSLTAGLFPGGISGTDRANANALRFLLGGIVGSGSIAANFVPGSGPTLGSPNIKRLNYNTTGLYFADQWQIRSNLTVNLGLRYDYFGPLTNPDQTFLEPDLKGASDINQIRAALINPNGQYVLAGTNTGTPGRFFNGDKNNFGPNVSFAYTPNIGGFLGSIFGKENKTVIRGGFRLGYINDEYVRSADNAAGANAGLDLTANAINPDDGSTSLNVRFNNLPNFTLPAFQNPPISFLQGTLNDGAFFNAVYAVDPNIKTQRNMEYSFGIQREIGFDTAIEIRYVGGRSNNLSRAFDFNQVNINAGGFLRDFLIARNNCLILAQSRNQTLDQNGCVDAQGRFGANGVQGLPGQVQNLPAFAALPFGSFLTNSTIVGQIVAGIPAQLATIYTQNGLDLGRDKVTGALDGTGINFRANPNAGVVDLLTNSGRYRYNALQMEIRRRFTQGFSFQANYTFQKILSDIQGDQQTRFDPFLDLNNTGLEFARADYDRTHTVNINALYELPFGQGKRFLNSGGLMNAVFGGFQLTSIINISSGVPLSIRDTSGTLNRNARSGRQTAFSNLMADEIKNLVGIFKKDGIIYFINPSVIGANGSATNGNVLGTPDSRFAGQVFFRNQPGQTGNLPRNFFNGPWYYNVDAGLIKNIAFNERLRLQLRAEAFNLFNRTNFFIAESSNIFNVASTTFGQISSSSTFPPRIMQFAVRFEF